jgi:hypothetical protein
MRLNTLERRALRGCRPPAHRVSSAEALFIALADEKTAIFMKTVFSLPEQRPVVTTKKSQIRWGGRCLWQVAIIEEPPPLGKRRRLLNIAYLVIDADNGRIRQRRFMTRILAGEYRQFVRAGRPLRADCTGRSP